MSLCLKNKLVQVSAMFHRHTLGVCPQQTTPGPEGAPFCFLTPHVKLFNFDPPDRGGYLTPSPPPNSIAVYIKPKTGDIRELSPPVIYYAERRG